MIITNTSFSPTVQRHLARRFFSIFRQAKHPLLVAHQRPDGDTLGAVTALIGWRQLYNLPVQAYCADSPPEYLHFLPYIE